MSDSRTSDDLDVIHDLEDVRRVGEFIALGSLIAVQLINVRYAKRDGS